MSDTSIYTCMNCEESFVKSKGFPTVRMSGLRCLEEREDGYICPSCQTDAALVEQGLITPQLALDKKLEHLKYLKQQSDELLSMKENYETFSKLWSDIEGEFIHKKGTKIKGANNYRITGYEIKIVKKKPDDATRSYYRDFNPSDPNGYVCKLYYEVNKLGASGRKTNDSFLIAYRDGNALPVIT